MMLVDSCKHVANGHQYVMYMSWEGCSAKHKRRKVEGGACQKKITVIMLSFKRCLGVGYSNISYDFG